MVNVGPLGPVCVCCGSWPCRQYTDARQRWIRTGDTTALAEMTERVQLDGTDEATPLGR